MGRAESAGDGVAGVSRVADSVARGITMTARTNPMHDRGFDEDEPAEPARLPVSRALLCVGAFLFTLALSLASFAVVMQGAIDEPYMGYRRYDAVVQVGVGTALITIWCCWSVAVIALVAGRRLPPLWLVALLWATVCVFYLSYSPLGYLQDIERHVIPASARGG